MALLCSIGVATLWGLLLSPKPRVRLPAAVRVAVEMAVFVAAAWALANLGHPDWGVAFVAADVAVLITLNRLGVTTGGDPLGADSRRRRP